MNNNPLRFVDPFGLCSDDEQQNEDPKERRLREINSIEDPETRQRELLYAMWADQLPGKVVEAGMPDYRAMLAKVGQGIYEFVGASGKTYVGQSGNMAERIAAHLNSGRLLPENLSTLRVTEVLGGKTAREIAEQIRINVLGGLKNLENLRNPIGPGRSNLLNGGPPQ